MGNSCVQAQGRQHHWNGDQPEVTAAKCGSHSACLLRMDRGGLSKRLVADKERGKRKADQRTYSKSRVRSPPTIRCNDVLGDEGQKDRPCPAPRKNDSEGEPTPPLKPCKHSA